MNLVVEGVVSKHSFSNEVESETMQKNWQYRHL